VPELRPPAFDQCGLNVFDPNDWSGLKSEFITRVQHRILQAHLPKAADGALAVDVGCGYGRHTGLLSGLGYRTFGIDPDLALLEFAKNAYPTIEFLHGQLPHLPIEPESCQLVGVFNVLRPLHLMGKLNVFDGIGRYVSDGGTIAVIENMRPGHTKYVEESTLQLWAQREGLVLTERVPFRVGRRWYLYAMMLGLYPRLALEGTVEREIRQTAALDHVPRFTYWNVLFLFRKSKAQGRASMALPAR
jgi:SAM-dependent methyltransferase